MSAHDSPDGHEPYPDPSLAHLHDDQFNAFLRSINTHGALAEPMFSTSPGVTPSSHPVQIPLPDPPVIVPSQPLPVIENQPIYLQSVYPDPPSPQQQEYGHTDYDLGPWQQQQSPRTVQFPMPNTAYPVEHNWQTSQPHTHAEAALRRPSGEYPSPHYQTTPSPAADLSPLPLTPGGVARSTTSRGNRAAHAAPYDPSARRVSAPSAHRIAEDTMLPKPRTPSPARMPPPIAVPQRPTPTSTKKRSRAETGGEAANITTRSRKAVTSSQTRVLLNASASGSHTKYPSQLQISTPSTTSPTYAPSSTIPSYTSHSPVQSSPLVSAPVILPPQSLSPATAPRRISPVHSPSAAQVANSPSPQSSRMTPAADSLLMSTHPGPSVAVNSSSFSSSSGSTSSSAVPSSLASSLYVSTSESSSIPRSIPIEALRGPQQVHVRPQRQSQRSQLRQPTPSATPSHRGAPYPQSASARFAYQAATKSARATYLRHITSNNFLNPEALLPSADPHARQVQHTPHHPLAPWLTTDINTAEHIPADMRYDANSRILSAVLAVPGIEEDKIAVTLEDVHFNRNRVLYVSAYMSSTFPWHEDDLRMAQHSEEVETIADAEELANKDHMGKGKAPDVGASPPVVSGGDRPRDEEASSGSPSEQAHDSSESTQDKSSTSNMDAQIQSPATDLPASQPTRMGHMPNIRELIYGRQVRVINVPPSTQFIH
ncbi:hypothetical protein D9619_010863 [Psilocybe cf. subviscida]|uniref:Uncharacterized protein n=1 Tax=Psilocybe cf. subviscida TaxID=2480587 RepID=A0A8H5EZZ8_9AGAR|nr:hypothetical protein D9619_010863 [Psilocybe cf. subviscida]